MLTKLILPYILHVFRLLRELSMFDLKVQHGRYLATLYLAANRYLATSSANTNLGVL